MWKLLLVFVLSVEAVRIRREIRQVSRNQRKRVFAAMNVLKATPDEEGKMKYGPKFQSYDKFVAKHLATAADTRCDQGHFGPSFLTFHRIATLEFEEALLAVDPKIESMPYWDYNIDARMENPREGIVWSDKWFGDSAGDPDNGWRVTNGQFGHWRIRSNATDISKWTSPFGYLRAPWNNNPSPYLTRSKLNCGAAAKFDTEAWEQCNKMPGYLDWFSCMNSAVHVPAHFWVGGIYNDDDQRFGIPMEGKACYTNYLGVVNGYVSGCVECPKSCDLCARETNLTKVANQCRCDVVRQPCQRAARAGATYGDFSDAWTSTNDPIFFFHHANMDRNFMAWQAAHPELAPDYSFPARGWPGLNCQGHALGDVIASRWPFDGSLIDESLAGKPLTNQDVVRLTPDNQVYQYDTLQPQTPCPKAYKA